MCKSVLQKLIEIMEEAPKVEGFVMDFEAGWHRRLNFSAGRSTLQFYRCLICLPLRRLREADMTD
ncbi:hypothetical protein MAR_013484 [Mya arenaria]|uniref:Uncharacterized protein n=1 Tax=Mya arenaria TaxID=6604 RepID=A0ABY7G0M5_MYAAR|nr:hypothetical protein MAR_013484 [Mya arenaria]